MRSPLVILAIAYLLSFASGGIQLPLTSTAMEKVGLSMSAIGVMWAARSVLGIFGPALWGVLADRRGDARPFGAASLFSGGALLAILAFTTSAPPAVIVFGLYGLLCGPAGSLIDGMVITALGEERQRFGRWRMWGTIGFGITAFGSAILVDRGWLEPSPRAIFPVCAIFTAAGGVMLLFVPPLARPALGSMRAVIPLLKRPDMLALFAVSTILWCSHIGYSSFLMPLATARGIPEWCVGASLASAIAVEALMLREAAYFTKRFGNRNVIVGVAALTVLRWALTAVTTNPVLFIALNALHGVTFGLFFATLVAMIAAKAPPEMRQAAQGFVGSSSFGLGGALGSLLVGASLDHIGAQNTWWAMAGVAALGLVVAWRTVR